MTQRGIRKFQDGVSLYRADHGRGSLKALADVAGVDQATLSRIEKGTIKSVNKEIWQRLHEYAPKYFSAPPSSHDPSHPDDLIEYHPLSGVWGELKRGMNSITDQAHDAGMSVVDACQLLSRFLDQFMTDVKKQQANQFENSAKPWQGDESSSEEPH